jgi:DNA-binding response OmpR family regulator
MTQPMSPRILIVDDDQDLAQEYAHAFQRKGWIVETAYSGFSALERYTQKRSDIVLLDLGMPGMDGLEVIVELRKKDPSSCVIFFTGLGTVENAVKALRLGAVDMFEKKGLDIALLIEKTRRTHDMYRKSLQAKRAEEYMMLSRFQQALSHQFRNNVAGVGTYLQSIEMKLQRPHQVADLIDLAKRAFATNKLTIKTLDRLNEFAKSQKFVPESVALRPTVNLGVENAVLMHAAYVTLGEDYSIFVDVPDGLIVVGHGAFLQVVIEALVDNAIYALRERSENEDVSRRIRIVAKTTDHHIRLLFEDSGRGFSDFILQDGPAMFRSSKEETNTGIGLATSQHILQQCGGTLAIENIIDPQTQTVLGARVVVELQTSSPLDSQSPEVQ